MTVVRGPTPARTQNLLIGIAIAVFLLLTLGPWRTTVQSLVAIWQRSDTFMHCFFVLPVSLYLLYEKSHRQPLPLLIPSFAGLWLFAAAGVLWCLGRAAAVAVVEQFALVGGMIGLCMSLLGPRFVVYAAYPLAFLLLAVPFGEGLVPRLIDLTTEFVVAGLRLLSIPVYREENLLTLPSGNWSVVSACSGIRYLLALISVAAVYAFLNIRSGGKRALFLAFAVLLALTGNWMRALGIVLLGHYSGNQLAVGADHLIYGWVFFGVLVLGLIVFGEWLFAEAPSPAGAVETSHNHMDPAPALQRGRIAGVLGALLLLTGGLAWMGPALVPPPSALHELPVAAPRLSGLIGAAVEVPEEGWTPDFSAAPAPNRFRYTESPANAGTGLAMPVDLLLYGFNDQGPGFEATAATNVLVAESNEQWTQVGASARVRAIPGLPATGFASYTIRAGGGEIRCVAMLWFSNRGYADSRVQIKIDETLDRLRRRPARAWVAVVSTRASDESDEAAWARLDQFVAEFVPAMNGKIRALSTSQEDAP